jgi:hypothetical protein
LSFAFGFAFPGLKIVEEDIKTPEVLFPKPAVPFQPDVELLQRGGPQSVNATLRVNARFDQASVAENAQVFGGLRLTDAQAMHHVTDGARAGAQKLDDAKAARLCQGFEGIEHGHNIPLREYACQGIFALRAKNQLAGQPARRRISAGWQEKLLKAGLYAVDAGARRREQWFNHAT